MTLHDLTRCDAAREHAASWWHKLQKQEMPPKCTRCNKRSLQHVLRSIQLHHVRLGPGALSCRSVAKVTCTNERPTGHVHNTGAELRIAGPASALLKLVRNMPRTAVMLTLPCAILKLIELVYSARLNFASFQYRQELVA